jgi:hypothetical protein
MDLEQGHIKFLTYIFLFFYLCKTNKPSLLQTKNFFCFVLIMAAQDDAEIRVEGNPEQRLPENQRQNSDRSSPTEVLETMRNLIVELQVFKADNEKLKKAQRNNKR